MQTTGDRTPLPALSDAHAALVDQGIGQLGANMRNALAEPKIVRETPTWIR